MALSIVNITSGINYLYAPLFAASICVFALTVLLFGGTYSKVLQIASDLLTYAATNENEQLAESRKAICQSVADTIIEVLAYEITPGEPFYEQVFVFGHSLGAAIGVDSLKLLYRYGIQSTAFMPSFNRIRGFVTYGSAYEKVEGYLVDPGAQAGIINTALRSYPRDMFVSCSDSVGKKAIPWLNMWYRNDPIAGTMHGLNALCKSIPLEHRRNLPFFSHGDYHDNPEFWKIALEEMLDVI